MEFLVDQEEAAGYATIRPSHEAEIARAASAHSNCHFVPIAPYFIDAVTSKVHLVNPDTSTLAYKDRHHLNVDGTEMVEQVLRTEIFNEQICASSAGRRAL